MKNEENKTPVFVETHDGIKEVGSYETKKEPEELFETKEFVIKPKIGIFKAAVIDDKFIEQLKVKSKKVTDYDYELVVYNDEFQTQCISLTEAHESKEEGKVEEEITLDLYTLIENDEYKEDSDSHITLHRGNKIARYNGLYNVIADGVEITEEVRKAIEIIKG